MVKPVLALLLTLCSGIAALQAQVVILDFEAPSTSTTFQYFGSSIDGQLTATVGNPNPTGQNTSATVLEFKKPTGAQVWAGAFSNPNPTTAVDLTVNNKITVKVHLDHIGSLTLKLEDATHAATGRFIKQ